MPVKTPGNLITLDGITLNYSQWGQRLGLAKNTISARLMKRSVEDAIAMEKGIYDKDSRERDPLGRFAKAAGNVAVGGPGKA